MLTEFGAAYLTVLEADRAKLNQGSNAMSAEQKEKLMRDIDQKTKALNRDTEDAQAELDQEQSKIMQELGQRIYAVIDKYSKDKGYSLILDVSSQQTPVLFASNDIDITSDIVKLYDQNAPAAGTSSGPAMHAPPAAPKPTSAAPPTREPGGARAARRGQGTSGSRRRAPPWSRRSRSG